MDNWVVGNFEGLMGLQAIPKTGLSQFLDAFEIPEVMLSANDVATMLTLNPSTVDGGGQIASIELADDQREAVLAQIPDAGISNRELESILEPLPFDLWRVTFGEYGTLLALLQGTEPLAPTIDIIAVLAPPPDSVTSSEPDVMYSTGVYNRGALAMHVLRLRVGDEVFFDIVRAYFERFGGGSAGSDDFMTRAEEVSGEDLDGFFQAWLEDPLIPDIPEMDLYKEDYR